MQLDLCPKEIATSLFARDFKSDVKNTAHAFKSWDTCRANKTCRIVAIVGFILAILLALWILSTLIRCICMGFSCVEALCCCCCRSAHKNRYMEPAQQPQYNSNMYPAPQMRQMDQSYQPVSTQVQDMNYRPYGQQPNDLGGYKPLQF